MDEFEQNEETTQSESITPPNRWTDLLIRGLAFTLLFIITITLIRQYIHSRPFDFIRISAQTATSIENFFTSHQIAPAQIATTDPLFIQSPRAHYYQQDYIVQLPAHTNLNALESIFHRTMRNNDLIVTDLTDSPADAGMAISYGEFTFATVRFEQALRPPPPQIQQPLTLSDNSPSLALPTSKPPPIKPEPTPEIQIAQPEASTNESYKGWVPAQRRDTNPIPTDPADDIQLARIPDTATAQVPKIDHANTTHKLAIIIDDGGYGGTLTDTILALDKRLTLAILPNTPHGTAIAEKAHALGFEIMLHMPMENLDPLLIHPGQINTTMDPERIAALTQDALTQVPQAIGINNHQGSKYTTDQDAMAHFINVIKDQNLYFIDSRTTHHSQAYNVSQTFGLPTARRDIFLDHQKTEAEVRKRFQEAIDLARKQGQAIAIGHFHPTTARLLTELLPTLEKEGITLVPASQLVQ